MKKYLFIVSTVIICLNLMFFTVGVVKAQDYGTQDQMQGINNYDSSSFNSPNCSGNQCCIRGTKTCPKTIMVPRTVCRQIMVPQTNYATVPFQAQTCENCTVQGTQTCPYTKMVPQTVCEQINEPQIVNETIPFNTCDA